ncbi:MAG: response regulator [Gemmatimonadales bacterium]
MARILLVDDDASVRRVVRLSFERAGYTVVEAASAFQALGMLRGDNAPDAVVCDVLMPGMTGLQFYRHLAERAPLLRRRVVFLTGANHDPDVHRRIEQLGVPLLGKLDDSRLVIDAVRIATDGADSTRGGLSNDWQRVVRSGDRCNIPENNDASMVAAGQSRIHHGHVDGRPGHARVHPRGHAPGKYRAGPRLVGRHLL